MTNGTGWAIGILLVGLLAAFTGNTANSKSACERDYNTVYVNRHTPYDIGVKRYCHNVNSGGVDPYRLH